MNKLDVRAQVLNCELCELSARCTAPVPFAGKIPTYLAVLGEAPGQDEDREGAPFVGKAGQLLRSAMTNAGLDVGEFCFMNTVSCFPQLENGRGRAPMLQEIEACAGNREDQFAASDARWVILTGNVPLQAYRPDLRIGRVHGQPLLKVGADKEIVLFPIYHPAAVLRNRSWTAEFESDLGVFKEMVTRESWAWVPMRCVMCGQAESSMKQLTIDEWGAGYCETCSQDRVTRR